MSAAILFSQMRPGADWAGRFHRWYDEEHIPARLTLPGFAAARRYEEEHGDHFLAVYHLDDAKVLTTPAYRALKEQPSAETAWMLSNVSGFTRYIADQLADTGRVSGPATCLLAVAFDVPLTRSEEFDAWYTQEHVPLLMRVPGWLRVRRYAARSEQAGPHVTRFALHELAERSALGSPLREEARNTAWRGRLAAEPWFAANQRWVYRLRRAFGGEERA